MIKLKDISTFLSTQTVILSAILIISFSFRYWHLSAIGWVDDEVAHYLGMRSTGYSVLHSSDTYVYERLANDIINGNGINLPYHPPMISIVLAVIFYFNNHNYFTAKIIFSVISSFTCALAYIIGKDLFSKETGIIAGILCSISFGLIMLNGALNTEALFSFLIMLSLLCMIRTKRSNRKSLAIVSGCVIGITVLTRTEFLLSLLFFIVWLIFQRDIDKRSCMTKILCLLSGFIFVIIPWTIRNYFYMTEYNKQHPSHNLPTFVPLTLNGPLNFAYGNNPTATGGYHLKFLGKEIGHPKKYYVSMSLDNPVHKKYILHGYREGLRFIIKNPMRWLFLLKEKFIIFKDFLAYGFGGRNLPGGLNGYRRNIADCFIPAFSLVIANSIFFLGGLILAIMRLKGGEEILPFLFIVSILCVNLAFHGLTRSGAAFLPIVFLYQAVFFTRLLSSLSANKIYMPIVSGALILLIFIAGYIESRNMIIIEESYSPPSMKIFTKISNVVPNF